MKSNAKARTRPVVLLAIAVGAVTAIALATKSRSRQPLGAGDLRIQDLQSENENAPELARDDPSLEAVLKQQLMLILRGRHLLWRGSCGSAAGDLVRDRPVQPGRGKVRPLSTPTA